jgi:regulatory protein YycI of two-component signal transduction system YycFG
MYLGEMMHYTSIIQYLDLLYNDSAHASLWGAIKNKFADRLFLLELMKCPDNMLESITDGIKSLIKQEADNNSYCVGQQKLLDNFDVFINQAIQKIQPYCLESFEESSFLHSNQYYDRSPIRYHTPFIMDDFLPFEELHAELLGSAPNVPF